MSATPQRKLSSVRHTRPFLLRYSALWFLIGGLAVLVAATSSYLLLLERDPHAARSAVFALVSEAVVSLVALGVLAVFTTHRVASPLVGLRLTCDAVRNGDLSRRFRLRRHNTELDDLEEAFNAMLDAVEARVKAAEGTRTA